jgi:iron(III) transport system permease protein
VQTFTTGIYRAWFSLGDRVAAAQLALVLLGLRALVLAARARQPRRAALPRHLAPAPAHGAFSLGRRRLLLARFACAAAGGGFLLPGGVLLLHMALTEGDAQFGERFVTLARNSMLLAA